LEKSNSSSAEAVRAPFHALLDSLRARWRDLLTALVLALALGFVTDARSLRVLDSARLHACNDVWFRADIFRVYRTMTVRDASNFRSRVHPFFPAASLVPVRGLIKLGLETRSAVRFMVAAQAAAWVAVLYAMLRAIGCRWLAATSFSLLGAVSAAAWFWLPISETYALGSITIMAAVIVAAVLERRALRDRWLVLANVLSFSITVTNWMAGIAATLAFRPLRRAALIVVGAFALCVVLWPAQLVIAPRVQFFMKSQENELNYLFYEDSGGPLTKLRGLALNGVVMPKLETYRQERQLHSRVLGVQHAPPGGASVAGWPAVVLWVGALGLGGWAFARDRERKRLRLAVGALLAGQLVLHLVYGEEVFLYALHYTPVLLVVAAWAALGAFPRVSVALALALLVPVSVNNHAAFQQGAEFVNQGCGTIKTP
jgi:hypothetical protein